MNETFGKDFYISVCNNRIIVSKNPNPFLTTLEELEDMNLRYLYKEGDRIVTPFGIQTIKSIDRHHSNQRGYEWLIFVEENGNQYKPCELIGIFVHEIDPNVIALFIEKPK